MKSVSVLAAALLAAVVEGDAGEVSVSSNVRVDA